MATLRHMVAYGLRGLGLATGLAFGLAFAGGCEEQSKGPNPSPEAIYDSVGEEFATNGGAPIATSAPEADTGGMLDEPDQAQATADDEPEAVQSSAVDGAEAAASTSLDQP